LQLDDDLFTKVLFSIINSQVAKNNLY